MDFANYPHPDALYPHPMEQWPESIEAPVSVVLDEDYAEIDEVPRYTLMPDPQNARFVAEPSCTITMPNGAQATIKRVGDPEGENSEEIYFGDWDAYTKGDKYIRDQILDVANETLLQSGK